MSDGVEVGVLGPVEVRVDGRPVDLGGARQRRLLAALAVDAGRVVSSDGLVDRVWSTGDLPDDPRRTLRTYLTRLRRSLGGDGALATEPSGWRLDLSAVQLDAQAFESMLASADDPGLDAHDRLGRLERALALWRGRAYDEVADEDWARTEAARLEELRITATERRYEAMLVAGMHTDALPGLAAEAEDHPFRERLVRLQMLALFRTGRLAEATRVFQDHRSRLADELGLEPSADLVDLDRRIVAGDPSLHLGEVGGRALRGYRLGEQLGEGAFAVVYRGTQPSVGRDVAVKIVRAELANRPEFVRRFEAEGHLVARLEHPFIVPLYDFWREPDRACLVFRYLRGGTLEARLTASGGLPADDARKMVTQVGAALAAAHDVGVVHRDVKPANVFLDGTGNFYLGDFGIALEAAELSDPTAALSAGSPAYASPEQLRRQPIGPSADVHGLGISVWEALTARLPFPDARTQAELLRRQLHDPVPSVLDVRADLPPGVDEALGRATAKDPADRYQRVEDFVADFVAALDDGQGHATAVPAGRATTVAVGEARNPYKGLRAFTEADSADFHGRERLTARLLELLRSDGTAGRIAAVVGPSGIGKSSVVRAGLLPALRTGAVPGSERWFIATMLPGSDPFDELATALIRVATRMPDNMSAELLADHRGIARVVKAVVPEDSDAELLLVIDQFEELFTLVADDAARSRFLAAIEHAVTDARCPIRVMLTMRADFWDRPLRHGSFARLIERSSVHVTALAPDELERAIVDPAYRVGCEFEPGLVSEIVADVTDQPGALPLLQYALTELWEHRVSGLLTREAYASIGGVTGALARRAEELYLEADTDEQSATRRMFERLVTLGEGTEDTRRRALRTELGDSPAVEAVVDRYGRSRLLSFDHDETSREPTVEVAHEALIRRWPRLRAWLDDDRDELRIMRHLSTAATEWDAAGRPPAELYRGGRLDAAEDWLARHPDTATPVEIEFVERGSAEREIRRENVRSENRRLRRLLAAVGIIALIALATGAVAFAQQREAADQRDRAEQATGRAAEQADRAMAASQEAAGQRDLAERRALDADVSRMVAQSERLIDVDRSLALLVAAEADGIAGTSESLGALQRSLVGVPRGWMGSMTGRGDYTSIDFVDERTIVAAGDGGLDVFDLDSGPVIRIEAAEGATAAAVSEHRDALALGGSDGRWALYDTVSWTSAAERWEDAPITALEMSPDGNVLAVGLLDGTAVLRDLSGSGADVELAAIDDDVPVGAIVWSPSSDVVVVAGAGGFSRARMHDVATGAQIGADMAIGPNPELAGASSIAWMGDGPVIANIDAARFDRTTGRPRQPALSIPTATNNPIVAIDDHRLLSVGVPTVSILDFETGTITSLMEDAQASASRAATLSADGAVLAIAREDRIELWALDGQRLIGSSFPSEGSVVNVNDDASVVTTSLGKIGEAGATVAYDGVTGVEVERFDRFEFAFLRGDGLVLVPGDPEVGIPDSLVWWTDGQPTQAFPTAPGLTRGLSLDRRFAVNPDRVDLVVDVWDLTTGEPAAELTYFADQTPADAPRLVGLPADVEFSPDSRRLIVTSRLLGAAVWDTETWELLATHTDADAFIDIDFTSDGETAVTLDVDGNLAIRKGSDLGRVSEPVAVVNSTDTLSGKLVAISEDRRFIMVSGADGALILDGGTLERIGDPFPHEGEIWSAQFAAAANKLATIVGEEVVLWDIEPGQWPDIACRAAGRNMTPEEWTEFGVSGEPYRATCPQWPELG